MKNETISSLSNGDVVRFEGISVVRIAFEGMEKRFIGKLVRLSIREGEWRLRMKPRVGYIHTSPGDNIEEPSQSLIISGDMPLQDMLVRINEKDQAFTLLSTEKVEWPEMSKDILVIRYKTVGSRKACAIVSARQKDIEDTDRMIQSVLNSLPPSAAAA